jgi:hypothetical protein
LSRHLPPAGLATLTFFRSRPGMVLSRMVENR